MDGKEHAGGGGDTTIGSREDHQTGECGRQGNGVLCPKHKPCCDKNGMCKLSEDACGHGCQENFGVCLASRTPPTKGNIRGDTGPGAGNANSLQAGDTGNQTTTVSPVIAAVVGASTFVAGILFALLLFAASKKREEKAMEYEKNEKNAVAVEAEKDHDLDNSNDDDRSMAGLSSIHNTPFFGNFSGEDEDDDGDYAFSPNPTMVDAEESNNNQLNLDEVEWQAATARTGGVTDDFGLNADSADLAALEQQLYNAEHRQQEQNHMSSIQEDNVNVPFDKAVYYNPAPMDPPAPGRDRYFDFNDNGDFLG